MDEFDLNPITIARNKALEAQKKFKEVQGQASLLEAKLEALKREEKDYHESFVERVREYYCLKLNVNVGDIIECDGEEYEFVKFDQLSKDPIVRRKLKSGKFSKRTEKIHLYNWDEKKRESLGSILL